MMCEVSLCRIEQLLLGIAHELRPALAIGDPAVLFVDRGHRSSVGTARLRSARPIGTPLCYPGVTPGGHEAERSQSLVGDTFPQR
jgi:hypothetical protein